jgi:fructose-bisphosphate aldolase class II
MALISLRQLLDHAAEHQYGLPAFNVNNMEQIHAIMQAADQLDSPVILQASAGARKYAGEPFLRMLVEAAVEQYPHIPICMHQDHGASPAVCQASIRSGFSSVMMDGSLKEDAEGVLDHSQLLTDPDEAADFVAKTQVDALAIAIGTSHGAYKFTRPPTGDILAIDRIKAINQRIPNTHLVMHGSSSVPQEWLEIIRHNGGKIKETYGVPVEEIVEGIKHGVRKINIDTDIRLAMTGAIRQFFTQHPEEFDPRAFLKVATAAAKGICEARFKSFGCAGQASKIKVIPLEKMATRYAKGELKAVIQ